MFLLIVCTTERIKLGFLDDCHFHFRFKLKYAH